MTIRSKRRANSVRCSKCGMTYYSVGTNGFDGLMWVLNHLAEKHPRAFNKAYKEWEKRIEAEVREEWERGR